MAIDPVTIKVVTVILKSTLGKKIIKAIFIFIPMMVLLVISLVFTSALSPTGADVDKYLQENAPNEYDVFTWIKSTWFPKEDTTDDTELTPPSFVDGEFIRPLLRYSTVSSHYGWRTLWGKQDFHLGTDYPAPSDTPIMACNDGIVTTAMYSSDYGNHVVIQHSDGITTLYAHAVSLDVTVGDRVVKGQRIAGVGTTGPSTGNHLHFEVKVNGARQDPALFLKNQVKKEEKGEDEK